MKRTRRIVCTVSALGALTACTPTQLDVWQQATGLPLSSDERAALVELPDAPMHIDADSVVTADGTIEHRRARHCDEWRALAVAAGWPAATFDSWASAIVWRESRCNAGARSSTNDWGLFQVNGIVLVDMQQRPELWREALDVLGHVPTRVELLDPYTNAVVARVLFSIRGTSPWR